MSPSSIGIQLLTHIVHIRFQVNGNTEALMMSLIHHVILFLASSRSRRDYFNVIKARSLFPHPISKSCWNFHNLTIALLRNTSEHQTTIKNLCLEKALT